MTTWDDVAKDLDGITCAMERMIVAFNSMTRTYTEFLEWLKEKGWIT